MRFVYDFDAEERKKTNNFITFPAQLDMSPYVDSSEACIYDLAGVLLHQGASAHFGHYTADVFDTSRRKWYHCDDELVQEISNPFKKRKEANSRKPPTSKSNNGKQRVFRVDDSDEESQNSNLSEQQCGNSSHVPAASSPDHVSESSGLKTPICLFTSGEILKAHPLNLSRRRKRPTLSHRCMKHFKQKRLTGSKGQISGCVSSNHF